VLQLNNDDSTKKIIITKIESTIYIQYFFDQSEFYDLFSFCLLFAMKKKVNMWTMNSCNYQLLEIAELLGENTLSLWIPYEVEHLSGITMKITEIEKKPFFSNKVCRKKIYFMSKNVVEIFTRIYSWQINLLSRSNKYRKMQKIVRIFNYCGCR
jgi:hypothetical protein